MQIERHVFGSFTGYATLAKSPGVRSDDCQILESAGFSCGQTNDPRYAPSLVTQPAFFTRELPGGRRSLTRILNGQPDDVGRPTSLLITAILTHRDWDGQLHGDVALLLSCAGLWEWDGVAAMSAVSLSAPVQPPAISPTQRGYLTELISEIERNYPAGRQTIVSARDYGPAEIALLETLLPPASRRRITTACRVLKPFPAEVVALADEAITQSANFRPTGAPSRMSPYAETLQTADFPSGRLPLEHIMSYPNFGQERSAPQSPMPYIPPPAAAPARRGDSLVALALVAFLGVFAAVAAYLIASSRSDAGINALRESHDKLAQDVDVLKQNVDALKQNTAILRKALTDAGVRLNTVDTKLNLAGDADVERDQLAKQVQAMEKAGRDFRAEMTSRLNKLDQDVGPVVAREKTRGSTSQPATQPAPPATQANNAAGKTKKTKPVS